MLMRENAGVSKSNRVRQQTTLVLERIYDVYYQTKDYQKSIPIVEKLIEFDANMKEDLVSLYMNTNQHTKALELLKIEWNRNPS